MNDQNPWVVENIEAFSFYCCPECDFKSKHGDSFKRHALESHNKSKSFFIIPNDKKYENNINSQCMDVETESEYQDKNKDGIKDFVESETRRKKESCSESEVSVDGVNIIIQKYDPFENENINVENSAKVLFSPKKSLEPQNFKEVSTEIPDDKAAKHLYVDMNHQSFDLMKEFDFGEGEKYSLNKYNKLNYILDQGSVPFNEKESNADNAKESGYSFDAGSEYNFGAKKVAGFDLGIESNFDKDNKDVFKGKEDFGKEREVFGKEESIGNEKKIQSKW